MVFSRFGLRIAALNANGIRSRIVELRNFINKHSFDIILIQETHLRPGVSIRVPNYTLYRNDRQNQNIPSGGTAILIKSSLNHHHLPTPSLGTVEATIVVLTPPGENPLRIAFIYIPPTPIPTACIHDLEEIFALEHSSILCGDYNAHHTHWGCYDINPRGNRLKI
ncbi:putative RNA-directed DNA polymerase from transposon X-element [Trichonephila clavipes]|nr:putative RNA-directed DNA polymerase from transposon X-element [Trichonephila clavipes]